MTTEPYWTIKRKLVTTEVVSFAVSGVTVLLYWYLQNYIAVGIVFTAEWFVSLANTLMWFARTAPGGSP